MKTINNTISGKELEKCSCTHKDTNGNIAMVYSTTGEETCKICGSIFKILNFTPKELREEIKSNLTFPLVDAIQTAKLLYLDISQEEARQLGSILYKINSADMILSETDLKVIGNAYQLAIENFEKHDRNILGYSNSQGFFMGGMNPSYSQMNIGNPYNGMIPNASSYPLYNATPKSINPYKKDADIITADEAYQLYYDTTRILINNDIKQLMEKIKEACISGCSEMVVNKPSLLKKEVRDILTDNKYKLTNTVTTNGEVVIISWGK